MNNWRASEASETLSGEFQSKIAIYIYIYVGLVREPLFVRMRVIGIGRHREIQLQKTGDILLKWRLTLVSRYIL